MIGAYGIVNRLAFFFVMIVMGLNQGMQPIAGYNFGARQYDRLMHVLKLTVIGATCVTIARIPAGRAAAPLGRGGLYDRLGADPTRGRRNAHRLPLFPDHRVQMVTTNFFQSIGMAPKAIFLSLSRQLLFLLPGLLFLPDILAGMGYNGSWGVWCSMPLSDLLASLVAAYAAARTAPLPQTNADLTILPYHERKIRHQHRTSARQRRQGRRRTAGRAFRHPVYDKRLIKMAAEHSGFGQEFFEKADEKPAKGFFAHPARLSAQSVRGRRRDL